MGKMQARIAYNKERDSYELWLSSDSGKSWDVSLSCKCQNGKNDIEEAEPMLVSIELIDSLKHCISLGYKIVY